MAEDIYSLWKDYYHNSNMREGLVSWYDFKPNSRILEWHPDRGALTGILAKKCKELVCVINSEEDKLVLSKRFIDYDNIKYQYNNELIGKFDYIVVYAPFRYRLMPDKVQEMYRNWSDLLSSDGILLFAVNNTFSALTTIGAINSMSRTDNIVNLKNQLGKIFSKVKFYYVYPDMVFPQEIYTDDCLPTKDVADQINPYAANIAELREVAVTDYKNAFSIMQPKDIAGSFLIECGNSELANSPKKMKITANRGANGLTTNIYDEYVEKVCIADEADKALNKLCSNLDALKNRGIATVPFEYNCNRVKMPFIKAPLLQVVLKELRNNKKEFYKILDLLFENIKNSSEFSEDVEQWNNEYGYENWGEFLENGYVEMTPLNCFYDNGKLLFFDQEYVVNNCPLKYIMFRCISHTFLDGDNVENELLEEAKKRYGLDELWSVFERVEQTFLQEICVDEYYAKFQRTFSLYNQCEYGRHPKLSLSIIEYLLADLKDKKIVCYGDGKLTDWFLRGYGQICDVDFTVSDNEALWGQSINGIIIKSPEEIESEKHRVVITCDDASRVEAYLKNRNIDDYKVVYRYDWD